LLLGCHYLSQVKRNCCRLWEAVALCTALSRPISTCEYYEEKHGHQIHRRVELFRNEASLPKGWNGVQRLVRVRRWGNRNGKPFDERSFYILSKPEAIQGHWGIENMLHWTKDMVMGEDDMTPRDKNTVSVVVCLNNAALNLLRLAGYKPVKDTFAKFANKVNELYNLFESRTPT
jgi:hypothetical protein